MLYVTDVDPSPVMHEMQDKIIFKINQNKSRHVRGLESDSKKLTATNHR